jgi:V8-like Glu-specific endopeptidase
MVKEYSIRILTLGFLASSALALASCLPAPPPRDRWTLVVVADKPERTLDRPEIGRFDLGSGHCTGTLIRPDIVLTAARCFPSSTGLIEPDGRFVIVRATADGASKLGFSEHRFDLAGAHSFLPDTGLDVAIVKLKKRVAREVATPTDIAEEAGPTDMSYVTLFAYGCEVFDEVGDTPWENVKRYAMTEWRDRKSHRICPGDSGGPIVDGRNGKILEIVVGRAGAHEHGGANLHAPVTTLRDRIIEEIDALTDP